MKTWLRLLIPLGLGLIAVVLNTRIMTDKLQPKVFVAISRNVGTDAVFSVNNIEPRSLNDNVAKLLQTAIPWEERAVLLGRPIPRPLHAGDLVLWRDATPPDRELSPMDGEASLPISLHDIDIIPSLLLVGEEVGFYVDGTIASAIQATPASPLDSQLTLPSQPGSKEPVYVGPFRLLSVGKRLTRTQEGTSSSNDGQVITIAFPVDKDGKTDRKTNQLLRARSQRSGIISIVLHHSKRSPGAIRNAQE